MTEEEFIDIRDSLYSQDFQYKNPFVQNKVNYMFLPKNLRNALFERLRNDIAHDKDRLVHECDKIIVDCENGVINASNSAQALYYADVLEDKMKKLDFLRDNLSNHTNFELINWLYNDGNLRTESELQDRKDAFVYYSDDFQDKINETSSFSVGSFLVGAAFFILAPFTMLFFGVDFFTCLAWVFGFACIQPITMGIGFIVMAGSSHCSYDKEEKRLINKFSGSYANKVALMAGAISTIASVKMTKDAFSSGWVEK